MIIAYMNPWGKGLNPEPWPCNPMIGLGRRTLKPALHTLPIPEGPYILPLWNTVPKEHPHYGVWDLIP